jgi:predicted dehydrogenase
VIARSDEADAVRVASVSEERANGFAAQHGMKGSGDLAALLNDPAVDAVYVAGRNRDHAPVSIAALAAGKAVLCEKPFACTPAEAQAVIEAARRAQRPFMEAVATPFLPAVAEAIARARLAEFGAVRRVEASFGYKVDRNREPGLFAADAGISRDRLVYPLVLALLISGPSIAQDVHAASPDAVRLSLRHGDGGVSDLAVSFAGRLANKLIIDCEQARVTVAAPLLSARRLFVGARAGESPVLAQNPFVRRAGDAIARLRGQWRSFGASPYDPELQHFCAMVRDGRIESPVLTHQIMLEVQRIIATVGERL